MRAIAFTLALALSGCAVPGPRALHERGYIDIDSPRGTLLQRKLERDTRFERLRDEPCYPGIQRG